MRELVLFEVLGRRAARGAAMVAQPGEEKSVKAGKPTGPLMLAAGFLGTVKLTEGKRRSVFIFRLDDPRHAWPADRTRQLSAINRSRARGDACRQPQCAALRHVGANYQDGRSAAYSSPVPSNHRAMEAQRRDRSLGQFVRIPFASIRQGNHAPRDQPLAQTPTDLGRR